MGEMEDIKNELADLKERHRVMREGNGKPGYEDMVRTLWGDDRSITNKGLVATAAQHEDRLENIERTARTQKNILWGVAFGVGITTVGSVAEWLPVVLKMLPF